MRVVGVLSTFGTGVVSRIHSPTTSASASLAPNVSRAMSIFSRTRPFTFTGALRNDARDRVTSSSVSSVSSLATTSTTTPAKRRTSATDRSYRRPAKRRGERR